MTYPLSNFNGVMVEVWEWIWNFITICGKILLHSHFIMDVVKWKTLATNQVVIMSKIRKNIYSSDVQVTFKLHGDFRCLQALCYKYNNFSKYRLTQWISKLPGILKSSVRQYLVNFRGLAGKGNTTVYRTEPILQISGMTHCPNF